MTREAVPLILDADLLGRFERALAERAGEVVSGATAGRTESEIREVFASLDLVPPTELLVWWGYHDDWSDGRYFEVIPSLEGVPLAGAVELYRTCRELAEQMATEPYSPVEMQDPEVHWQRAWVPIFYTGGMEKIVADCSGDGRAAAIRKVDPSETGQPEHGSLLAASLGEFIERAVTGLEGGRFVYDRDQSIWQPTLPWPWIIGEDV